MCELGSHDMVSKGLLSQYGEERMVSHWRPCGRPLLRLGGNLRPQLVFSEMPFGSSNVPNSGVDL